MSNTLTKLITYIVINILNFPILNQKMLFILTLIHIKIKIEKLYIYTSYLENDILKLYILNP